MTIINGRACVVNGTPVDKVFSNGKQVYGRNLFPNSSKELTYVTWTGYEYHPIRFNLSEYGLNFGDEIFYSYYVDNTMRTSEASSLIFCYDENGNSTGNSVVNYVRAGTVGYVRTSIVIPQNTVTVMVPTARKSGGTGSLAYSENKLELNGFTAWTPAPEDVM